MCLLIHPICVNLCVCTCVSINVHWGQMSTSGDSSGIINLVLDTGSLIGLVLAEQKSGIMGSCQHIQFFYVGSRDWTKVLMLKWQVLCWINYLSSSTYPSCNEYGSVMEKCAVIFLQCLSRTQNAAHFQPYSALYLTLKPSSTFIPNSITDYSSTFAAFIYSLLPA